MRVLVSPATKHGGTIEIGRHIARTLRQRGIDVDVTQPEHVQLFAPYSGFVVGSGLYMGKWLPSASEFLEEHADAIRRQPTWLFSSGPLGDAKPVEPIRPEVREHLLAVSSALDHQLFGGRLRFDLLGRTDGFIARWVKAEEGDYRDWEEIERWATSIADQLLSQHDDPAPAIDKSPEDNHATAPSLTLAVERLTESIRDFETDHPDLSRAVNDLANHLSALGI